jgi:hypothetical protein
MMSAEALKRIIAAPPATGVSLFEVYAQPPSAMGKQAPPSGSGCHGYSVFGTSSPVVAMSRELNPAGRRSPFASGKSEIGPYGLGPGTAGCAKTWRQNAAPRVTPQKPAAVQARNWRRFMQAGCLRDYYKDI